MQAKEMAGELKYPKGEAMALKYMGMVYYMKGMYAETLGFWIESLEVFEKIGDDVGVSNMLNNIGAIYLNQGADDKALEYMLKSLKLAEKTGDTLRIATALGNVGGIYHNKKDPIAINYLLKAIPLLEGSNYKLEYIGLTANIGEVYFDNNNTQKAFEYFRKSLKAAGNTFDATFGYSGIGRTHMKDGNYEMALLNLNTALSIAQKEDDKLQIFRVLRGLADVYQKQNMTSLAIDYNHRAQEIAEQMDDVNIELSELYKAMSVAYEKQEDFSNAYMYKTLYSDIKDTLRPNKTV
ncbi:MAG: tetratricopeptide repeat protein [Sphingobacteriales bacterium]|nr:MAG: tetratricopeptide repeat protein [Sphingobacteriales bacterium]